VNSTEPNGAAIEKSEIYRSTRVSMPWGWDRRWDCDDAPHPSGECEALDAPLPCFAPPKRFL